LKVNLKLIFVVLISVFGISHSFAQTLGEIKKNADVLFDRSVANTKKILRVNKQSVLFLNESTLENNTSSSLIDSTENQTHSLLNNTIEKNLISYNKDRIVIAEFENIIPVEMEAVIIELDTDTYEEKTNDLGSVTYLSNLLDTYEIEKNRLNVYK